MADFIENGPRNVWVRKRRPNEQMNSIDIVGDI